MKFRLVLHEFTLSGSMATMKPEIIIAVRRYEIEVQFRCLDKFSMTPKSVDHRPTSSFEYFFYMNFVACFKVDKIGRIKQS